MTITTTETVPGKEITEILGISRGSVVRAKSIGNDFMAGLKNIIGGEVQEYTKLQAEAREQAIVRMQKDAEELGADAIVNVRFESSTIAAGMSELMAYGTAVKLK